MFDLQLLNGCPPRDNVGIFTDVSQHGYSVVDYFWMRSAFTNCVQKLTVEERIESDHMPLELHFTFCMDADLHECEKTRSRKEKIVWLKKK